MHDSAAPQPISSSSKQGSGMVLTELEYEPLLYIVQNMRDADRREVFATTWHDDDAVLTDEIMRAVKGGAVGFIGWRDGEPIAAVGMTPMWPGVVSAWMFATDSFPKIGLGMTKFSKRYLIPAMWKAGVHRIQCFSHDTHEWAHRWLRSFGAQAEANVADFGRNREGFVLFSLLNDQL